MRIHVVPVYELTDQHLVAEYREIKMLPKALVRSLKSKTPIKIPKEYTLNGGHGKFFYNKLNFIEQRFNELVTEMKSRGFATNATSLYDAEYDYSLITSDLRGNYSVTQEALRINRERITERINVKHYFYRFRGKTLKEFK